MVNVENGAPFETLGNSANPPGYSGVERDSEPGLSP